MDFSKTYYVSKIRIWNRVDCCSERLNGVTVRLNGQKNILATLDTRKGNPIEIKVNDDLTSIILYGGNSHLSLAEVEVFGLAKTEPDNIYENIAGERKATQCDSWAGKYGFAHLAVDGNTDGRWNSKSVTHTTKQGKDAWWRLDFSKTYYVSKIRIWNRVDCCSERLNGVTIRVDDQNNILVTLDPSKGNLNLLEPRSSTGTEHKIDVELLCSSFTS